VERSNDPVSAVRQATVPLVGQLDGSDRLADIHTICAPTVVLHGADDPDVPMEAARDIAEWIPGAELRILPGLGHNIPLPLVPEFVEAITAAAARASSPVTP